MRSLSAAATRATSSGSPLKRPRADLAAAAIGGIGLAVFVLAHAAGVPGAQPNLLPPEKAFRLSARALDPSTVEARFDVADGYYLYRDKLRFALEPVPGSGFTLPRGIPKHDEFFGDVETYRGAVVVRLPLSRPAPGQTLTLSTDSQGCADVGVCYPPNPQKVRLTLPGPGAGPGPFVEPAAKGWFK